MSASRITMAISFLTISLFALALSKPALAQTESVLYSFDLKSGDGHEPIGGLVLDNAGNLFGTAYTSSGSPNCGVVFYLTPALTYTNLDFSNTDGCHPESTLFLDTNGNLWGTTASGGSKNSGVVFEVPFGFTTITDIYNFSGGSDGSAPVAPLFPGIGGNLYGSTFRGGSSGNGVVFRVSARGAERVLHSFAGGPSDGAQPEGVIRDSHGNLFGTTFNGGASAFGAVFKIPAGGTEQLLYSFKGGKDGGSPQGGLILKGNTIYGTTYQGGASGNGTVFKLTYSTIKHSWKEHVIYSFTGPNDGYRPNGGLIRDSAGNFYGTTLQGGVNSTGTAFKISPGGGFTLLHAFGSSSTDGQSPQSGLVMDSSGTLYGTTPTGGVNGGGTVYKILP